MPKLLLKLEAAVIKEITLDKPVFTIGRKPDNDIALDHATVSGHHCKIYSAGGSWFVEDLNSTNGIFVNGKRALKAGLRQNDAIAIAKYSLIFSDDGGPEAQSAQQTGAPAAQCAQRTGVPAAPQPRQELPQQKTIPKAALEVLENPAGDKKEFELTASSSYIGKSSQANIPYKAGGLFGSGPDMAAVITRRPEGYFLSPVKEGYTKHNGDPLNAKIPLKDDDIIAVGSTKFRFFIKKT
ncbi:MAG: FHA domain-containing protein [Elusimicrobia bacterium]|nr:FHA domain-containing protein [Elusimicrobiota bacterium]